MGHEAAYRTHCEISVIELFSNSRQRVFKLYISITNYPGTITGDMVVWYSITNITCRVGYTMNHELFHEFLCVNNVSNKNITINIFTRQKQSGRIFGCSSVLRDIGTFSARSRSYKHARWWLCWISFHTQHALYRYPRVIYLFSTQFVSTQVTKQLPVYIHWNQRLRHIGKLTMG